MKTPDTPLKKFARDVSKPQEKLLKTIMEFTAANTLTDGHIADQKIELEQAVENQKGVVEDYNKKILLAQNKEDEAEDIFVIAQNPGKFVDTSDNNKSKQELKKEEDELDRTILLSEVEEDLINSGHADLDDEEND